MTITEPLVLSPDVLVIRVSDLPAPVREEIGDKGAFALTRARARATSSLVDEAVAELLREFRSPCTIVEAVIRYSRRLGLDPERTLTESYTTLRRCVTEGYLVAAGSEGAQLKEIGLAVGQRVASGAVVRCLHVLEDTELYQLALDDGRLAALKMLRPTRSAFGEGSLQRELEILRHLDGRVAPRLLEVGDTDGNPWLVLEWCDGVLVTTAAASLRRAAEDAGQAELLRLCARVAGAYGELHELGVVHGDVHPGNVLVSPTGLVRLVDFGLAHLSSGDHPPRGGVQSFFDPEYAAALRARRNPPPLSPLAEQYSVAALLYELFTGSPYVDFSIDPSELFRQIVEEKPLPFTRRGRRAWPEVEELLGRVLSKKSSDRLTSTAELARRLRAIDTPPAPRPAGRIAGEGTGLEPVLAALVARVRPGGEWFERGLPTPPFCSVAYGSAGVAIALCRIAALRGDPELAALADEWAVRAAREAASPNAFTSEELELTEDMTGKVTPYHRLSGVHAVQALVSHTLNDVYTRQRSLDAFVAESRQPCEKLDVTLGRSGTLLVAAILLETVAATRYADLSEVLALGNETLTGLWAELAAVPPIPEETHVTYLGVAHGWAGMLLATLRWCRAAKVPRPPELEERLNQLAGLAQRVGLAVRWPWTNAQARSGSTSFMPGWCNGSAGHVYLWTTAHSVLGDERWLALAEQAAWDVYATPNRIAHLCCGLAGQAWALVDLYRHTGEQRWLTAAMEMGTRAATALVTPQPGMVIPGSLHKGDVGVAVLAADLAVPEAAAMPLFGSDI